MAWIPTCIHHLDRSYSYNPFRYFSQDLAQFEVNKRFNIMRKRSLHERHGLSVEALEELHKLQDYSCAICKIPFALIQATVDHDHECCPGSFSCGNCIRGILCIRCNAALGMVRDNIETMLSAIQYLQRRTYYDINNVSIDIQDLIYGIE